MLEAITAKSTGTVCEFCTNDRLLNDEGRPTGVYRWETNSRFDNEWYECRDQAIRWTDRRTARLEIATNIHERKQNELERAILHERLEDALTKVLRGFLPICASCKKIRDEQGRWNQIEEYIHDRSEAEFSHGICPECIKKYYKGLEVAEG